MSGRPCWVCLGKGYVGGPLHREPCPTCRKGDDRRRNAEERASSFAEVLLGLGFVEEAPGVFVNPREAPPPDGIHPRRCECGTFRSPEVKCPRCRRVSGNEEVGGDRRDENGTVERDRLTTKGEG